MLPAVGLQAKVRSNLKFWAKCGAHRQLLCWIQHGVDIPFHSQPQPFHHSNPEWPLAERSYWQEKLKPEYLSAGAIVQLAAPTSFCCSTYLTPKKGTTDFRHIVDLRPLNKYVITPKCKFETLSWLPDLHLPGE